MPKAAHDKGLPPLACSVFSLEGKWSLLPHGQDTQQGDAPGTSDLSQGSSLITDPLGTQPPLCLLSYFWFGVIQVLIVPRAYQCFYNCFWGCIVFVFQMKHLGWVLMVTSLGRCCNLGCLNSANINIAGKDIVSGTLSSPCRDPPPKADTCQYSPFAYRILQHRCVCVNPNCSVCLWCLPPLSLQKWENGWRELVWVPKCGTSPWDFHWVLYVDGMHFALPSPLQAVVKSRREI